MILSIDAFLSLIHFSFFSVWMENKMEFSLSFVWERKENRGRKEINACFPLAIRVLF